MPKRPRPVRATIEAVGAFWACVLGATLAAVVIAGLWIWIATATSGARGTAAVTRQHNSGSNQVTQNTRLLGDYATVQADLAQIKILAVSQADQQDRINLQGLRLNCASDINAYNADAQNILAAGYLPPGQPIALDASLCTTGGTLPSPTTTNW